MSAEEAIDQWAAEISGGLLDEIREQVIEDMELWKVQGPENSFKEGFDTAVRKYAEILGLLDTPLYENWEDRI